MHVLIKINTIFYAAFSCLALSMICDKFCDFATKTKAEILTLLTAYMALPKHLH